MWSYLAIPTYLIELFMENFFTLSWVVERWNLSSMSLLLSLFLKSIGENMIIMILWLHTIRRSDTLFWYVVPHLGLTNVPSDPTL
jgi:hypothetical protein